MMKNKKGFTLVELLGVIVIFSVLVTIITIAADKNLKKAKTKLSKIPAFITSCLLMLLGNTLSTVFNPSWQITLFIFILIMQTKPI